MAVWSTVTGDLTPMSLCLLSGHSSVLSLQHIALDGELAHSRL